MKTALTKTKYFDAEIDSDEPQMENTEHYDQLMLLTSVLKHNYWRDRRDYFIGSNLSVYYDQINPQKRKFIGPDFFYANTTNYNPKRKSWRVWAEGKFPDAIIELLSDSTENIDKIDKFNLYEQEWKIPEYFWFSPETLEFKGFRLITNKYQSISFQQVQANKNLLWSEQMKIYLGVYQQELRCFEPDGLLILNLKEMAQLYKSTIKK